jgi:hypothetical protein
MNCANWEERIALYMGGDLRAAESPEVERHLAECPGCQVFASGIRESLAVLREAHAEDVDELAFVAVRARVLSRLERGHAPLWRSAWVYGLLAAALLLAMVWMRPAGPKPHIEAVRHQAPVPQAVVTPIPVEPTPVRVVRAHRRRHRRPIGPPLIAASPEKPLVVKLVTDDPNVVIYWITDTRGE